MPRKSNRRREFLIDSNQNNRSKPKRFRNQVLNILVRFLFLKKLSRLLKGSVLGWIAVILMTGFIVFSLFSPYFAIKKINVLRDNPNLDILAVEESMKEFFGKNMLFLSKQEVSSKLIEQFPEFTEININEKWPDEVDVSIVVSPPAFAIYNSETANYSVITRDGITLNQEASETLPVLILQQYDKSIPVRTKLLSEKEIEQILTAQQFTIEELGLGVEEIRFLWAAQEIHLVLNNGTVLWIDSTLDVTEQLKKLIVADKEIGLYQKEFQHIDLRIPDQIFWLPIY